MNTYFNEFTNKPEKLPGNGAYEKMPAGALCGNGDLGVVLSNDETDLIIHISKCDFWKFIPGAHKDGGIKTVGNIRIENIDLTEYNIKQYFDEGLIKCCFSDTKIEFFVAPQNIIYFETKTPVSKNLPVINIEMPDTCNSVNSEFAENDVTCYTRKFTGENIDIETAVTVCLKEINTNKSDDCSISRYCVSVCTNFDSSNHTKKAVEMASGCDYDADKVKTREKWQKFFAASKVTLEDKEIEKFYNSSLYHLAGCMGNKGFPPGLFGNFITDDFFPWAGDYHMNYNYEAPYYCIFSSNHPELFDGYMTPVNEMSEYAQSFAKLFNCRGYAFPVSFGPKALDVFSQADCKEHGVLFLGQKSHAAYACVIPLMHWFSTYDKEYASENYYNFIFNVALFWEDYLTKEKGKYVIKKDAAHEIPYYRGKEFKFITHFGQVNTINAINSLGLVKLLFKGVYDMAKELGLNSEKYALWEDINKNLSDFPTFIKHGKKCFRYSKFGIRWRDDNTVGLQHIYPASQIGFSSGEKLLKIAKNTYFINDRRLDDNGSNSYLPAGARIGVDPEFLIEGIHQNIKEFALPNRLFRHHGGGIEHLTTVPATINEMLMQSYEDVIRLFPCWNKKSDASFTNLRADGAFLVSAELKNENISSLKIKSLKGRNCNVECSDIKAVVREADNKKIEFKRNGNIISFETQPDEAYILM
ncbi:MAG: hypothetical protein E7557_07440 [Ruminococcaceae bacterium]|nr:hypothetical protein [Oscillospiraceae bacterium]